MILAAEPQVKKVSELKNISIEKTIEETGKNAIMLFDLNV
jgi:Tat protein secretion system quality control protein TatD with DNase activity